MMIKKREDTKTETKEQEKSNEHFSCLSSLQHKNNYKFSEKIK